MANRDGAFSGDRRAAVDRLAADVAGYLNDGRGVRSYPYGETCAALLRLEGGDAAIASAISAALDGGGPNVHMASQWAERAAILAGPRVASMRPALERRRAVASADDQERIAIGVALAATSDDPETVALTGSDEPATVDRLLAMGTAGRRAVVLLAGSEWGGTAVADLLDGTSLADEIFAAVNAAAPDPYAERRRVGAARLGRSLPPERALALWSMLAGDPSERVRIVVIGELRDAETRSPGSVPVALVAPLLRDEQWAGPAALLAGALGPRASELVPALRSLRDARDPSTAPQAAMALWLITRSAAESHSALRAVLATADLGEVQVQWADLAAALAEMPLGKADLDVLVAVIGADPPSSANATLLPLLERFGADAAPAVPALRRILAYRDDESGYAAEAHEPAVRVLGVIGAAARPALPDLRKWSADYGDPHGVARDAIRKIEAAGAAAPR
jgi:hypothetical protein